MEGLEEETGCNYIKISGIKDNKNTQILLCIGLVAWRCHGRMADSTQFKKARCVWKANDWDKSSVIRKNIDFPHVIKWKYKK